MLSIDAKFDMSILKPSDLVTLTMGMWIKSGLRRYGPFFRLLRPRKVPRIDFWVRWLVRGALRPSLPAVAVALLSLDYELLFDSFPLDFELFLCVIPGSI